MSYARAVDDVLAASEEGLASSWGSRIPLVGVAEDDDSLPAVRSAHRAATGLLFRDTRHGTGEDMLLTTRDREDEDRFDAALAELGAEGDLWDPGAMENERS